MRNKKTFILYSLRVFVGALAFIAFNIAYALFTIHGFSPLTKAILLIIPIILSLIFITWLYTSIRGMKKGSAKARQILVHSAMAGVLGWILLVGGIYFLDYHVLYTNSPVRQELFTRLQQMENYEEICIPVQDNLELGGFLVKEQSQPKSPLLIYFGGRGEEASGIVEYASKIKGYSIAFVNYRGCGSSQGKQGQKEILSDSLAVYDYFAARGDIDKDNIALAAHSLGTGVAIYVASQREVRGVVLSAPYDKYTSGVIQDKFPLVPMAVIISEEFDSLSIATKLETPALFLLAEEDKTVLKSRSMRLFNSWGGKAQRVVIEGTHHENVILNSKTWETINSFLKEL